MSVGASGARCSCCGYCLVGKSRAVCPECGRPYDPADSTTFDAPGQRYRIGRRFIMGGMICSMYPLLILATMAVSVADRMVQLGVAGKIGYAFFNLLTCMGPAVFVCHVVLLAVAPFAAGYAREALWTRWVVASGVGVALWCGLFLLTLFLLPLLVL